MSDKNHSHLLKANLKQLRLPMISAEFEKLAREAAEAGEGYEQYLLRLTELEVAKRSANAMQSRIKQAAFPVHKDFDTYNFSVMPSLNKQKMLELARARPRAQPQGARQIVITSKQFAECQRSLHQFSGK